MIPVNGVPLPADFEAKVTIPGNQWLAKHPKPKRVPDLWSPFKHHLADGFSRRCGYAGMHDPTGTVDHYRGVKNFRHLAYEWHNYRFVSGPINSSKRDLDDKVLDPYQVGPGWFEIILPSLQLRATDAVPPELKAKAEYTLERLKLQDGEAMIRWRQNWYEAYREGLVTLDGLRYFAPLIAEAIEKQSS